MPEVVGIRFKQAGPVYSFDPSGVEFEIGDWVIVETSRGQSLGRVITHIKEVPSSEVQEQLKPVVRKAKPQEIGKAEDFKAKEAEALSKCAELIDTQELPMQPILAEYNFDGSHLTIYFTAESKVDFRALLKELKSILRTRVELRQIGARDVAKLIGGVGRCGRPICCVTHLSKFDPISVRMARDQALPLNPASISGICGKLLCCLKYEHAQYLAMKEENASAVEDVSVLANGLDEVTEIDQPEETPTVPTEQQAKQSPRPSRRRRPRRKRG